MDKYNLRSSKHLWAVFLTAGLFVPGLVQGAAEQALSEIISMPAQKTITGKVIDETGETIIGANVVVKGTTNGAVTDMDGQFHLAVNDYPVTLTVSYIGYETQTVKVSSSKSIVITMQSDNQVMDEVIVTGYGTFKKSAYAGSASAVKADKIKDIPAVSFQSMLQGNAAGVQFSSSSGQPGASSSINIRGMGSFNASNTPLYVIDGVPVISGSIDATGSDSGLDTCLPSILRILRTYLSLKMRQQLLCMVHELQMV